MTDQSPNNLLVNYMMATDPSAAIQFQRQQAIAQMLAEDSNQQMPANELANPGGYVINQSPYAMAGKALEKGLSGYLQNKNNAALIKAMQGNTVPNTNGINPTSQGASLGSAMMGNQGEAPINPMAPVTGDMMRDSLLKNLNPTAYEEKVKSIYANQALTPEEKNFRDPAMHGLVQGGMVKNAILPGQTFNGRTDVPIDMRNLQPISGNTSTASVAAPSPQVNNIPAIPAAPTAPTAQQITPAPAGAAPPPPMNNTNITGFGMPIGATANANKNAEDLADAQKTFNVTASNLPRALQRFEQLKAASKDASSGYGIDESGEGPKQTFAQSWAGQKVEPNTATANQTIQQASKQGIIAELGPQLVGMRPNKFLESIATGASGLNAADPSATKIHAVQGLEDQYVGSLKSLANQIRNYGGQAPSEAEIDEMIAKARPQQNSGNSNVIRYNAQGQRM